MNQSSINIFVKILLLLQLVCLKVCKSDLFLPVVLCIRTGKAECDGQWLRCCFELEAGAVNKSFMLKNMILYYGGKISSLVVW